MFIKKLTKTAFFNLCAKTDFSGKIRFYSHDDNDELVQVSYLFDGEHYVLCGLDSSVAYMARSTASQLVESYKLLNLS